MPLPSEEVIVRVTTQLAELQAGMERAVSIVVDSNAKMVGAGESAGETLSTSSNQAAEAIQGAYTKASEEVTASWTSATEAMNAATEASSEQIVASQEAVTASAARSQEEMVAYATAFNAAVQAKIDALNRLNAAMRGNLASTEGMAEAEYALDNAMQVGALTAQEQAVYMERLAAAEELDTAATLENVAAKEAQSAAIAGVAMNSRASAELGTMLGEALAGNFGRIRRSAAAMANQTGLLTKVINALVSPVGLATVAIGAMGGMAYVQERQIDKLRQSLLATGDAAGVTTSELNDWATQAGESAGTIGHAQEIYAQLAASGRLTGEELRQAGLAAVYMAQATDMSSQQASQAIMQMVENPRTAIMRLNDQYHYLNASQHEQVQSMLDSGHTIEAVVLALTALTKHMQGASDEAKRDGPIWTGWGDAIANAAHHAGEQLDLLFGGGTLQQKIDALSAGHGKEIHAGEIAQLQAQLDAQKKKAHTAGLMSDIIEPAQGFGKEGLDADMARMRRTEAMEQLSYDQRIKFEQQFWQHILETATKGSEEYIAAYEHLQGMGKKTPGISSDARKAQREKAQAYKEEADADIAELQRKRVAEDAYSADRIKIDQQIVDTARILYGEDSSEYRSALAEKARDEKAFHEGQVRLQIDDIQRSMAHEQAKTAIAEDAINQRLALNQITESEAIGQREQLEQALYQQELAEYQRELALQNGKVAEQARINGEIEALQDQHLQRMEQFQDQAQQANVRRWEKMLQPVSQAINGSVQGMIQGTQTAGQAISNFARNALASFINMEFQKLIHYIAVQAGMTSAQVAGDTARTASHAAAAVETKTIDAATGHTQINTAAATGAAKAYQAVVGIPYVGPILAPIAAGVAYAGIEAFGGGISSAQGGWERVPADGMMTELHRDEQVLPAGYAEGLRRLVEQGGRGGGDVHHHHYNVQAWDGRSLKDFLRRNPGALAAAAAHAGRMGY